MFFFWGGAETALREVQLPYLTGTVDREAFQEWRPAERWHTQGSITQTDTESFVNVPEFCVGILYAKLYLQYSIVISLFYV